MNQRSKSFFRKIDTPLVLLYAALVLTGCWSIYASVYNPDIGSGFAWNSSYGRQLMWLGISVFIGILILVLESKVISLLAWPMYSLGIVFLGLTLLFGQEVSGSKSWLDLGFFRLQPSELAKVTTALALAKYLGGRPLTKWTHYGLPILIFGLPMGLVLLQGDLGSASVFAAFILVLYREGMPGVIIVSLALLLVIVLISLVWPFIWIALTLVGLCFLYYLFTWSARSNKWIPVLVCSLCIGVSYGTHFGFDKVLKEHQRNRINVTLGLEKDEKGVGYNLNQSKIAIGSGGFTGKGFLKGTQTKLNFVPEQSTDFIFCTIGEEQGFWGSLLVLGLFSALLLRVLELSENQRWRFSRVYGYGVFSIIAFHVLINVSMTIGLFPVIGIPLPLISYGGSSLLGFTVLLAIFIKLNADRIQMIR